MTITVEIDADSNSSATDRLNDAIAALGLQMQGDPLVMGNHTFQYYQLDDTGKADRVIKKLLAMQGISAAYIQAGSAPPL